MILLTSSFLYSVSIVTMLSSFSLWHHELERRIPFQSSFLGLIIVEHLLSIALVVLYSLLDSYALYLTWLPSYWSYTSLYLSDFWCLLAKFAILPILESCSSMIFPWHSRGSFIIFVVLKYFIFYYYFCFLIFHYPISYFLQLFIFRVFTAPSSPDVVSPPNPPVQMQNWNNA